MKTILITLFFLLQYSILIAQTSQIYGYVSTKNGKGILNVTVTLDDYAEAVRTDNEGYFVIKGNFNLPSYNLSFFKEGYKFSCQEKRANIDGGLKRTYLYESNEEGLWFLVKDDTENKKNVKNAKITINDREYYTDENGFRFIPIKDTKFLSGTPILYSVTKYGFGTISNKVKYKMGNRAIEVELPKRKEQGIKIKVKDKITHNPLEDVIVIIDNSSKMTDQNGYVCFSDILPGNYTISAKVKVTKGVKRINNIKYRPYSDLIKFNGSVKTIEIEMEWTEVHNQSQGVWKEIMENIWEAIRNLADGITFSKE